MGVLPPGIWFVYRPGYGRYAGAYPVTWQGWWLVFGVIGVLEAVIAGSVLLLLLFGDEDGGDGGAGGAIWIGAVCVIVLAVGLGLRPVIRRHTDYSITVKEWRARRRAQGL